MDEIYINSIKKGGIALSRNTPVALVVGAAGFLGSHLTDRLLNMGIQVIGVDNFSTGKKIKLEEAIKQKGFHLVLEDVGKIDLDLERLDYLFVVAGEGWDVSNLLQLFKKHQARCLFVSSIDLYDDQELNDSLKWYKQTESKIAKFAHQQNLNARILRLGPIFGPRMRFAGNDPIGDLIKDALLDRLQKGESSHFSSRSLFIADAVDLLVKCIFSGATALKIFDGVLSTPLKVSDVKQILLDPVWYEQKGFKPQELPPWPTPNLGKTIQILSWKPKSDLVSALKQTLNYFRDNEIKPSDEKISDEIKQLGEQDREKREELEAFTRVAEEEKEKKKKKAGKINLPKVRWSILAAWAAVFFIAYSLIVPIFSLFWGTLTFRNQLSLASENLKQGEFDVSLQNLAWAQGGLTQAQFVFQSFEPLRKLGIFQAQFELGDNLENLANYSLTAANSTVAGVAELYLGLKAVTGEIPDAANSHFQTALIELTEAFNNLERANALLSDEQFQTSIPAFLQGRADSLKQKLSAYSNLVSRMRSASLLLPELVSKDSRSYLVLLQNNMELRPTGGFIGSYAKVTFDSGKLKKLEVNDIYAIDGQLALHVEPPKEIKEDLGQKDWFLRDSNWEPDFPTAAKQAEWFYTKETGEKVSGVIAVDVSAMESLLEATGPLQLADYDETITHENLFERAVTHAEQSFFAGSQAKKSFLTSLTNELFHKIFFLPKPNWPGIVQSLAKSLESKHISLFLDNPTLFSYLVSEGWSGAFPRASEKGEFSDFLAPVEANLGANKANYYLDRRYDLETVIGQEGEIKHRLKITYTNRSPSETFPAGKYKNRIRVYLPFGSKLVRVLWGETNITKDVSSFVDFGRSGLSMLLELEPKMVKTLILDIEGPQKLEFMEGRTFYKLDIIKQAGTLNDPFEWKLTYPINLQIVSTQTEKIGPQELNISTDLSKDRSFEVVFEK